MSEYIVKYVSKYMLDEGVFERAEEIVRCRDCKYATADQSDHDFRELLWCNFHRMDVKPDGFCAWGERRGTDGEH